MGDVTAKSKNVGDVIVRRRRAAVAPLRRDRRQSDEPGAPGVPDWGRIVFRAGRVTLR